MSGILCQATLLKQGYGDVQECNEKVGCDTAGGMIDRLVFSPDNKGMTAEIPDKFGR